MSSWLCKVLLIIDGEFIIKRSIEELRLVVVLSGTDAADAGTWAGATGSGEAWTGSATADRAGDDTTDGGTTVGLELFGSVVEEPLVATFTVKPLQLFWCVWK